METERNKRIAVLTSVRNDTMFLDRWIAHYGAAFGVQSLFVFVDGLDQPRPKADVNVIQMPFVQRSRTAGDKSRARKASALAKILFESFDLVIATDVDEFLVVDPATNQSLADYLSAMPDRSCTSALGLDVAQHLTLEAPITDGPFLDQRGFAKISDRYTKALILSKPLSWGSGQHRVKSRNFTIDPNLYLFHFGSVDADVATARANDGDRIAEGWTNHQARRTALFDEITTAKPIDGDQRFASARREMNRRRPIYAWNKPGKLSQDAVIRIPDRFRGTV
jgi:hypothetical protein